MKFLITVKSPFLTKGFIVNAILEKIQRLTLRDVKHILSLFEVEELEGGYKK